MFASHAPDALALHQAPQAGEVIAFDVKDGEAVEYLQTVVHIAPFFGGERPFRQLLSRLLRVAGGNAVTSG